MNAFKLEQYRMVLEVLEQMKDCLDRGVTYTTVKGKPFNLSTSFGICWHVYAHTPDHIVTGIGTDFLVPVFDEMGLSPVYPVECQITGHASLARIAYNSQRDLYDPANQFGVERIKLVDHLCQYYRKELESL
jgi:hypothetical protein